MILFPFLLLIIQDRSWKVRYTSTGSQLQYTEFSNKYLKKIKTNLKNTSFNNKKSLKDIYSNSTTIEASNPKITSNPSSCHFILNIKEGNPDKKHQDFSIIDFVVSILAINC